MKRLHKLIIFSFLLFTSAYAGEKNFYNKSKSAQIFEVRCGKAIMKISSKGGRIISYRIGETEFLTSQSEHENFGSTLWTAPQSDWGWPPYAVLDSMEYSVENIGDIVKMTSKPDYKSGFQFEKRWRVIGNHSIQISYFIRNISKKTKTVGAWEVTRVPCGGVAFFPDGGKAKLPESNLKPNQQIEGINWLLINHQPISESQKLYSTASEGWLAYALNSVLLIKQFPDVRPEDYAPQQGEVEIYINNKKSYIELENHGSWRSLVPGESQSYVVNWVLVNIPKNVKTQSGNKALIDFARQQIHNHKN